MKKQMIVGAVLAALGIGMVLGEAQSHPIQPAQSVYCPTEDSCKPMYEHGHWTGVPIIP